MYKNVYLGIAKDSFNELQCKCNKGFQVSFPHENAEKCYIVTCAECGEELLKINSECVIEECFSCFIFLKHYTIKHTSKNVVFKLLRISYNRLCKMAINAFYISKGHPELVVKV